MMIYYEANISVHIIKYILEYHLLWFMFNGLMIHKTREGVKGPFCVGARSPEGAYYP